MKAILFLTLVTILATVFAKEQAEVCSYTSLQATKTKYVNFLESLKNTTVIDDARLQEISSKFTSFFSEVSACTTEMGTHIAGGSVKTVKISTANCLEEKDSIPWNLDPCCNEALLDTQCCRPKLRNIKYISISAYKETQLKQKCGNPTKFKRILNFIVRRLGIRIIACTSALLTRVRKSFEVYGDLIRCYIDTISNPPECDEHTDCSSGVCNKIVGVCDTTGPDHTLALSKCLIGKLSSRGGRFMRRLFKLTGESTDAELNTKFNSFVTKDACVNENGKTLDVTKQTQSTCIAEKTCTLGGAATCTQSKTHFCGLICNPRSNRCHYDVTQITDEQTCNSKGFCIGMPAFNNGQPWTRATCENGTNTKCSALECNDKNNGACDAAKCAAYSTCIGFPSRRKDVCILPFEKGTSGENKCSSTRVFSHIGCADWNIATETKCTNGGGSWKLYPTTKTACESYKRCFNVVARRFTNRDSSVCKGCGGKFLPVFKWRPASIQPATFFDAFKWTKVELVNKRKWSKAVDNSNLSKFIFVYLFANVFDIYASFLTCSIGPIVHAANAYACDCGTPKAPDGTDCYKNDGVRVFNSVVFSKIGQTYNFTDGNIELSNKTLTNTDSLDITIQKTEADVQERDAPTTETTKILLQQQRLSSPYSSTLMGFFDPIPTGPFVVGDGLAIKSAQPLSSSVVLCINKNPLAAAPPAGYTTPAFVLKTSTETYHNSNVKITADEGDKICGVVNDQKTYYPAYTSYAITSTSISFALLVIVSLISLLF